MQGWPQECKIQIVPAYMHEDALKSYLTLRDTEKSDWNLFKAAMNGIHPAATKNEAASHLEFTSIAQGKEETLDQVSSRICTLARPAHPDKTTSQLEKVKCEQLIDALYSDETRAALLNASYDNYSALLANAKRIETRVQKSSIRYTLASKNPNNPSNNNRTSTGWVGTAVAKSDTAHEEAATRPQAPDQSLVQVVVDTVQKALQQSKQEAQVKVADTAPRAAAAPSKSAVVDDRQTDPRSEWLCFNCREPGHFIRDCPKPLRPYKERMAESQQRNGPPSNRGRGRGQGGYQNNAPSPGARAGNANAPPNQGTQPASDASAGTSKAGQQQQATAAASPPSADGANVGLGTALTTPPHPVFTRIPAPPVAAAAPVSYAAATLPTSVHSHEGQRQAPARAQSSSLSQLLYQDGRAVRMITAMQGSLSNGLTGMVDPVWTPDPAAITQQLAPQIGYGPPPLPYGNMYDGRNLGAYASNPVLVPQVGSSATQWPVGFQPRPATVDDPTGAFMHVLHPGKVVPSRPPGLLPPSPPDSVVMAPLSQAGFDGMAMLSPFHPISDRIQSDMDMMRAQGTVEGYDSVIAGCIIALPIHGVPMAVLLDTGATISLISEKAATLLEVTQHLSRCPSTVQAEVFGAPGNSLRFESHLDVSLGPMANAYRCQVFGEMDLDCLMGDDLISALNMVIDYRTRMVATPWGVYPMLSRGQVIQTLVSTDDFSRIASMPRQRHA